MPAKAKRIRKVGSIEDAQRELWRAIVCARDVLMDADSGAELTLKAAHAVQQCTSAFVRIQDAVDLEKRIEALEAAEEARKAAGLAQLRRAV